MLFLPLVPVLQIGTERSAGMFGWFKKRKAYNMGRDVGAAIMGGLEGYIKLRLLPVGERSVEVYREILDTVYDKPEVHPKTLVYVEPESFGRTRYANKTYRDLFMGDYRGPYRA